jgi:hypothetical protein
MEVTGTIFKPRPGVVSCFFAMPESIWYPHSETTGSDGVKEAESSE